MAVLRGVRLAAKFSNRFSESIQNAYLKHLKALPEALMGWRIRLNGERIGFGERWVVRDIRSGRGGGCSKVVPKYAKTISKYTKNVDERLT